MVTKDWQACPIDMSDLDLSGENLRQHWDELHAGNREAFPEHESLQEAWRCYHLGDFAKAVNIGLEMGGEGTVPAAFAGTIYAQYIEQDEGKKSEIFKAVMDWCEKAIADGHSSANLHYIFAVAMGRYSQFISMIEALAQGFGGRMKEQVDRCIELDDEHAEGHVTLGAWNAELSDKAGAMMAKMLYGATKDGAFENYDRALAIAPDSPVPYIEYAAGLEILFGDAKKDEVIARLEAAMEKPAVDAMQRLDQEKARKHLVTLKA